MGKAKRVQVNKRGGLEEQISQNEFAQAKGRVKVYIDQN